MTTTLSTVADGYILVRAISPAGAVAIRAAVNCFSRYLGRSATLADLCDATVSAWIAATESCLAKRTVAGYRSTVLTIWRDAAGQGLCQPPNRVRRCPRPRPCPHAWTIAELRQLLQCAASLTGCYGAVPKATYMQALIRAAYETGLRRSDLWSLRREEIRDDGTIWRRQHKTGAAHACRLEPDTLDLIALLPGDTPLAWQWGSPRRFYDEWQLLLVMARLRAGALQQLRRTGATHVAIRDRSAVQRYLGHATAAMQAHYVDESLASGEIVRPPKI